MTSPATTSRSESSPLRRRLPLILALVIGTIVWRGGFGFFATTREVTWRLEIPYGEVRKVSLEIWNEGQLVRREERSTPTGLSSELRQEVVLRRGQHRARARVWLGGAAEPREFGTVFDPGEASALVLELASQPGGGPGR
ncbi:MAG: hypothetical protein MUC96_28810 [Myxococcaceae bacterium]|nr:hypothetical protein [Myxococcaceae bacterium]